ncbi:hypothetical protein [Glutamicibacter sp. HZAU]|uniref:hypothetical protein n=1 Tax=Glutamicibacter sp. HZAU TaxID=2049891 RepID=UPI001F1644D4|nr:hypothetical protein [Glutamicibacter sp. HZAU]
MEIPKKSLDCRDTKTLFMDLIPEFSFHISILESAQACPELALASASATVAGLDSATADTVESAVVACSGAALHPAASKANDDRAITDLARMNNSSQVMNGQSI